MLFVRPSPLSNFQDRLLGDPCFFGSQGCSTDTCRGRARIPCAKLLVNVTFDGTITYGSSKPGWERLVVVFGGVGVEKLSYVIRIVSSLL